MTPIFCIVDPNLDSFVGHHAAYDRAVAQGAERAGYASVVLGHARLAGGAWSGGGASTLVGNARLVPAFSRDIWAGAGGGNPLMRHLRDRQRNRLFRKDLARHLPELPPGSIILAHMLTAGQIGGLADFAGRLPKGVRLVPLLRYQPSFYLGAIARAAFRRFERLAAAGADIGMATDSDLLSARIGRLTSLPVATLPIPHTPADIAPPSPDPHRPLTFVSLGNARGEKGFAEILAAARGIAAMPGASHGIRFVLQANDPSEDVAGALRGFRAKLPPGVTLEEKALDHAGYEALLASADVILAPYRRDIYEDRTSGVALEAMASGRPLICTRGTWLSELVQRHGSGMTIPDGDIEALKDAVLDMRGNWMAHAAAAARAAPACRAEHNADALIQRITSPWPATTPAAPTRSVAIFYPWGDFVEGGSGASLRTNLMARLLGDAVEEVVVVQGGAASPWVRRGNLRIESSADRQRDILLRRALGLLTLPLLWPGGRGQHLMMSLHLTRLANPEFHAHAERVIARADHVFLEYTFWTPVIARLCRRYRVGLTVTNHDVVSHQVSRSRLLREATLRLELAGMAKADHAVCVSDRDRAVFAERGVTAQVIANPINLAQADFHLPVHAGRILSSYYGLSLPAGQICLFVGSDFGPNRAAAEALRTIASQMPLSDGARGAVIVVAGGCMAPQAGPNFLALGRVPELVLRSLYRMASLAVIPLTAGTGSSIKTIEAMAERLPVLGTRLAFRGLPVTPGKDCFQEDELEAWPHLIPAILDARGHADEIAKSGRRLAEQFDYRAVMAPYLAMLGCEASIGTTGQGYAREVAQLSARAAADLLERAVESRDLDLMHDASDRLLRSTLGRAATADHLVRN